MEDFSLTVRIPKMDEFSGKAFMSGLHDHSDEIATEVLHRIEDRTKVDTGALKEDETYKLGRGEELVTWFVGEDYQIAENKRYYAPYQEGPPLGLSTYTNDPHQMFFKVTTDDLGLIADWAQRVIDDAAEAMSSAAEAGASTLEF